MIKQPGNVLAHLDRTAIEAAYQGAPGNEIGSGKFLSPQSSSALLANTFGLFFTAPERLPPLPGLGDCAWPACEVTPEAILRFPWAGGRHPCVDVAITTDKALIAVEAKRYEPFRPKSSPELSAAYWRDVWGQRMTGYQHIRDGLRDSALGFEHLDAGQLVKHALGLRTAAKKRNLRPVLLYLYAEPDAWPEGRAIGREAIERHRQEIAYFAHRVREDEVAFAVLSYHDLLTSWSRASSDDLRAHAAALPEHFRYNASEPLWRTDDAKTGLGLAQFD